MANWIINELEVVCDNHATERVQELLLVDGVFSFEATLPIPAGFRIGEPVAGYPNENVWCTEVWGTKWNAQEIGELNVPAGAFGWYFSTGWTAPELWFRELNQRLSLLDEGNVVVTLSWADPSDSTGYHMTRNAAGVVERVAMTKQEVTDFLGADEDE